MEDDLEAADQRQQGADSQAETVEGGQRVEHNVRVRTEADMRAHLLDVGHDVLMAEHHAFRLAFGA